MNETRPYHVLDDPIIIAVIALGAALTTAFPVFLEQQLCLPVLNGLVIFPLFVWALRAGRPRRAVSLGLIWLLCQSAAGVLASLLLPEQAAATIAGGLELRTETLTWIANGQGLESDPAAFLPLRLREFGLFALAALLSGGLGSFILLALHLNAVNFTVASLIGQATRPLLLALTAWPVWRIVQLVGALISAAVLAEPLAAFDLRPRWLAAWWSQRQRLLFTGLAVLLLGLFLQILLAPLWPALLRSATGLDG